MIVASQLTKRYGAVRAVTEVSFAVEHGEIVGLLDPNGAGKSTTMRMLACSLAPTSGTAELAGARRRHGGTLPGDACPARPRAA